MAIRPEEVTSILERELQGFAPELEQVGVGTVLEVGDGIARIYGLQDVMASELIEFPGSIMGMVLNLEEDNVGVVLLGESREVVEGQQVRRTGKIIQVPVGAAMVGRVVDALGRPLDGKGPIATAVLPVCRSPMISSRCPRPIGIMASIALSPVCIGSRTGCRSMTPGATRSSG